MSEDLVERITALLAAKRRPQIGRDPAKVIGDL